MPLTRNIDLIEAAADATASALFALAVAFCACALVGAATPLLPAASAALAFLVAAGGLRSVSREEVAHALPAFALVSVVNRLTV